MFLLSPDVFHWDLLILTAMTISIALGFGCFLLIIRKRLAHSGLEQFQHTEVGSKPRKKVRGSFVLSVLGLTGFALFGLIFYGTFIEPQMIVVNRQEITHPLGHNLTIAVVSDFHVGPYKGKEFVEEAVEIINKQYPDLVLIPGDFVYTRRARISDLVPLKSLRASAGVFAVLGNHDVGQYQSLTGKRYAGKDWGDTIASALGGFGITVLRNERQEVNVPDGSLVVSGIDDLWTGHHDLPATLDGTIRNRFTILLSHNPSVITEPRGRDAHLVISGHTHGGQVRIPGIGPISSLPTNLGKEYDQGIFEIDEDSLLAITRGIGESSPRMRLFAWPEILILELKKG